MKTICRCGRFQWYLVVSALLIGALVVVSGVVVGGFFEAQALSNEEEHTAQVVRAQAQEHLSPNEFTFPLDPAPQTILGTFFGDLTGIFRVKVFDRTGRIVWSNEPRLIGLVFPDNSSLARALTGHVVTVLGAPKGSEHVFERAKASVAETYVPIVLPGSPCIVGVVETYKDMTERTGAIRRTQWTIWAAAGGAGALLYLVLGAVVWNACQGERRAIGTLQARNRELTLVQHFTESVFRPLNRAELAASIVESAGCGLGLAATALYRVQSDGGVALRAAWPAEGTIDALPKTLVPEALGAGQEVAREDCAAIPMASPRVIEHVFLARFKPPAAGSPALPTLRIMLHEAAIALANADLYTEVLEAHERLAAILAGVVDRMLIVDRDMRVVWMNLAAAEGHALNGSAPGRRCFEFFGAEVKTCEGCPAVRAFDSGRVERGVRAQRPRGGQVRFLDLVAAPLRDAAGRVHQVLEVSRDITELVEMEERLKHSAARLEESHAELSVKAEELERANRALREAQAQLVDKERLAAVGQVVVGLHHAILNPLTGILGALEVLKHEEIGARTREAIDAAESEIWKIEQLVRRLPFVRRTTGTPYVGRTTMLDLERACNDEPPRRPP